MRQPLIVGNWKMNGSRRGAAELAAAVAKAAPPAAAVDIAVCPPFVHLAEAAAALDGSSVALGAQNVADAPEGARTGEVAAGMLTELGCRYAIVGHSERREHYAEDDALVARRFAAAHGNGLMPILCVGETLVERDAGATAAVVVRQLDAAMDALAEAAPGEMVVAYEPVWAIGTGRTATPEQAQEVHALLRERIAGRCGKAAAGGIRLLYGGSMKPENAAALLAKPDVDGGLIGGASLVPEDFLAICRAAAGR